MVASIGFFFYFETAKLSYSTSDFDQVCIRLHGLISACISDSLAFNVAVAFNDLRSKCLVFVL